MINHIQILLYLPLSLELFQLFEDYFEKVGIFNITIDRILYHNIDISFSLLFFELVAA